MLEWSLKGEAVLGLQVYIPSAQCFLCGPAPLAQPPSHSRLSSHRGLGQSKLLRGSLPLLPVREGEEERERDVLSSGSVGPARQ